MENNTSRHESVQEPTRTRDWWKSLLLRMFQFGFTSYSYDKVTLRTEHGTFEMTGKVGGMLDSADAFDLLTKMGEYNSFTFESYKGNKIASFIYIPALQSPVIDLIFHKGVDYRLQNDFVRVFHGIPYAFDYYGLDARYDNREIWEPLGKLLDDHGFSYDVIWNGGDDEVWPSTGECDMILSSLSPFHVRLTNKDDNRFVGLLDFEESGRVSLHENYTSDMGDMININESILPWINARIHQTETKEEESPDPSGNAMCSPKAAQDAAAINTLFSLVKKSIDSGFVNNFGVMPYEGDWFEKSYDPDNESLYSYCQELHNHALGFGTIIGYLDDSPVFSFLYCPQSDRKTLSFSRLCFESDGNYTVPGRLKDAYDWASQYDTGAKQTLWLDTHSTEEWKHLSAQLTRRGLTDKIYVRSGYDRKSLSSLIHSVETSVGVGIGSDGTLFLPLVKGGDLISMLGFNEDGSMFVYGGCTRSEQDKEWIERDIIGPMSNPVDTSSPSSSYSERLTGILNVLTYTHPVTTVLCITGASQPEVVYEVRVRGFKEDVIIKTDFPRSPYGLDMYIVYAQDSTKKSVPVFTFTIDSNNDNRVRVYRVAAGRHVFDGNPPAGLQTEKQKETYRLLKESIDTGFKEDFSGKGGEWSPEVIKGRMIVLCDWLTKLQEKDMELFYVGSRFKLHNLSRGMRVMDPSGINPNYVIVQKHGKAVGLIQVSHTNRFMTLVGNYWGDRKVNIRKWMSDANALMYDISPDDVIRSNSEEPLPSINLPDPKTLQHQARDMANSVMTFWDERKFDDSINLAVGVVVEYLCYATLLNRSPEFDIRYWNAAFWEKVVNGEEQLVRTGPVHDELMHRISNTFIGNIGFHHRLEEATPTVTLFLAKINDIARAFFPKEG